MLIVRRTWSGVSTHFSRRRTEWWGALSLYAWGAILVMPDEKWQTSANLGLRTFTDLLAIAPENVWGMAAMAVGALRFLSLIINGSWYNTPLFKYAPYGRLAASFLSVFFWLQICISLLKSGSVPQLLAFVFPLLLSDLYNVYLTAGDTREAGKRNGSSRSGPL